MGIVHPPPDDEPRETPLQIVTRLGLLRDDLWDDEDDEDEVPPDPFPVTQVRDVVDYIESRVYGCGFRRFYPWLGVASTVVPKVRTYATWLRDRDGDHPRLHDGSFDLVERHHDGDFITVCLDPRGAPEGRRGLGGYIQMLVAGMDTRIDWNVTILSARDIANAVEAYITTIDHWAPPD